MPLNTPFLYLTFPADSTGFSADTRTSWNDSSGNNRHCAPAHGLPTVTSPGKVGSYSLHCASLNPTYIPAMDTGWSAMTTITIAYWARRTVGAGASEYIVGKEGANVGIHDGGGWHLGNGVSFTSIDNGRNTSGVPDSDWHHYAFTYDGSTMRSYFDGVEIDDAPLAGGIVGGTLNTDYCIIGGPNIAFPVVSNGWDGQVDQFTIWDEALSGADISTLYNGGTGLALSVSPKTGLDTIRTYFRFENNYSDSSGNSYNSATTTGDPTFVSSTLASGTAAVEFDGDDYVYNDLYAVNIGPWVRSNQVTISLWIKTTDPTVITPTKSYIAHQNSHAAPHVPLGWTLLNDSKWWVPQIQGGGLSPFTWKSCRAEINADGNWHHYVLAFDGEFLHSYVDGVQISGGGANTSCRGGRIINTSPIAGAAQGVSPFRNLGIGKDNRNDPAIDPCIADIDEVAIFNEALQPADVSLLYNGGTGRDVTPVTPTPPLPDIPIQDAATDRKDYIIVSTDVAQISRQYDRTVPYVPFSRVIKGPATLRGVVTAYTASRG